MSRFHTFTKNESSSESEEDGQLVGDDEDEEDVHQRPQETNNLDIKSLKPSKSLQILDKIDTKRKNRFSVWSDILLEEELNHSVAKSMDIKKVKRDQLDRQSENYSFWTKRESETNSAQMAKQNADPKHSLDHLSIKSKNKRKKNKKRKKDKKDDFRRSDFALEVAKKLNEPKLDLMSKS